MRATGHSVVCWLLVTLGWVGCAKEQPAPPVETAPVAEPAPVLVVDPVQGDALLTAISALEGARDPKCHATASRLEGFMYGTPLTPQARFEKNRRQRALATAIWRAAHQKATRAGRASIQVADIEAATTAFVTLSAGPAGNWRVVGRAAEANISAPDQAHYGSIAYSLRAVLSAWQQQLIGVHKALLPLELAAIDQLAQSIDRVSLAALQSADASARRAGERTIGDARVTAAWDALLPPQAAPQGPVEAQGALGGAGQATAYGGRPVGHQPEGLPRGVAHGLGLSCSAVDLPGLFDRARRQGGWR